MNSTTNYALKLRKVRLFLNLSQRELSRRIGVSASTISRYENERTPVSPRVKKWGNRMFRKYSLSKKVIKSAKDNSVCSFMQNRCYSIADDDKILHRLSLNPCILDFSFNYVFQYLGTQGIHHCFREIHGGWRRTYTNSQLIDKRYRKFLTSLWLVDFKGVIHEYKRACNYPNVLCTNERRFIMKKYDLCVKSGTYTDRSGNEKALWENIGCVMENGNSPYILLKPWVNLAGFPRDEGRNHLIVSLFEQKENEQRSTRANDKGGNFSADIQPEEQYDPNKIPF